jgi:hypothetical protein
MSPGFGNGLQRLGTSSPALACPAPQGMAARSSRLTLAPFLARKQAVDRPRTPPPITTISGRLTNRHLPGLPSGSKCST